MDTRQRNSLLAVLFAGVLMGALDIAIVGPALPAIEAEFGLTSRESSWIFTVYVLTNLVGTPLMARLSDFFGRRAVYTLDVTLFAVGSLVVAASHGSALFAVLLLGRAIQGLGAGGIFPVASAVIGDTFPPERRGSALGLIGAVFGLAFLVGPVIGGLLLGFGWQWLFLINLPVAAMVVAVGWRLLPRTRAAASGGFDWAGMAALALALTGLALGLNAIDSTRFWASLASPEVLGWLAVSAWRGSCSSSSSDAPGTRSSRPACSAGASSGSDSSSRPGPGWGRRAWCSCRPWRSRRWASIHRWPATC